MGVHFFLRWHTKINHLLFAFFTCLFINHLFLCLPLVSEACVFPPLSFPIHPVRSSGPEGSGEDDAVSSSPLVGGYLPSTLSHSGTFHHSRCVVPGLRTLMKEPVLIQHEFEFSHDQGGHRMSIGEEFGCEKSIRKCDNIKNLNTI